MADKRKVPEIRFKGLEGEWEERRLGDIAEEYYGGGTPKTSATDYWNGNIPWIQSSDIPEGQLSNIEPRKGISEQGIKFSATKLVPENSIAIVTRVGVGKLAFMPYKYATSQDFLSLSKLKIDSWFATYLIWKKIQSELHSVQGTSIKGITKEELLSKAIMVAPSEKEQSKIGTFFQNLDSLITLHQCKHYKLTTVKKAMLEKMFPKDGADVPEIRFKGFTEKWERRTLGEVSESIEYGLNSPAMEFDGNNKYLRITDIDDVSHKFRTDNLTSPNIDVALSEKYKLKEGDILLARTGASVGKSYIYDKGDGLVYFAGFLIRARIIPQYNAEFVFQNTLTMAYENFVKITSQRSGQPGINAQEYIEFSFMFPEQEEQSQIGTFFQNLDSLITLQQRELDKLKNIKKACLEKMFV